MFGKIGRRDGTIHRGPNAGGTLWKFNRRKIERICQGVRTINYALLIDNRDTLLATFFATTTLSYFQDDFVCCNSYILRIERIYQSTYVYH